MKENSTNIPRWQYRFTNYKRAFSLLRQAIELKHEREISDLEAEGIIQRFEYTWELAWNTIKDYLKKEGVTLNKITPNSVITAGIKALIITNREGWMAALDDRNSMSHRYSNEEFLEVIDNIEQKHLALFEQLYETLIVEDLNTTYNNEQDE